MLKGMAALHLCVGKVKLGNVLLVSNHIDYKSEGGNKVLLSFLQKYWKVSQN